MISVAAPEENTNATTATRLSIVFQEKPIALDGLHEALHLASTALGLTSGEDVELLISPTRVLFQRLRDLRSNAVDGDVEQGILFGQKGQIEFREVAPGQFRIVAFREDLPLTLTGWQSEEVIVLREEGDPQPFILWGSRVAESRPEWQEGRIPFPQAYPWETGSPIPLHLAVIAVVYRDPLNRSPLYVHWQTFTPAKEPDRASAHGQEAGEHLGSGGESDA